MSLRRAIVEANIDDLNVREFCRQHGVSTWFFYDLRRRHRAVGDRVLVPGSRAPHRVANRIDAELEDAIVRVRKQLVDGGFDAGPATIHYHLSQELDAAPSEATIWRTLRSRALIVPQPAKAPKRAKRRFQADRANQRWQIDATHWSLADGIGVEIINVLDDCTRVVVASVAVTTCTTAAALEAVTRGAQRWGWPEGILSDNGSAFRGRPGGPDLGGLAAAVLLLGIHADRSRPYHPQTCGKVERFHQTLKRHLAALGPAPTLAELQGQLDRFVEYYNTVRPHRALGRRPPAQVWQITPRSGPADRVLDTPTSVHRSTATNGTVWAGRRYRIAVGAAYNGQRATVVLTGRNCHVFVDGRLARHLIVDPSRQDQPLRLRSGPPAER